MDSTTIIVIVVVIITVIAAGVGLYYATQQSSSPSPPTTLMPVVDSPTGGSSTPGGSGTASADWMYPRGELDFMSSEGAKSCVAAYALHHVNSKYKGPVVKIKRLGDSVKENFYADAERELKTESGKKLKDWLAEYPGDSTAAMIDTWYDQSTDAKGRPNKQDTDVAKYTSSTRIEKRDDKRQKGWQIRFRDTDVIRLGSGNSNNILKTYSEFTIVMNARWSDKEWATALWMGPNIGNDSDPAKSYVYIGNYGSSGRYAFMYAGNDNQKQVMSDRQAPAKEALAKESFTNFIMVAKRKSDAITEVKGYIDGQGFNMDESDVLYSGKAPSSQLIHNDVIFLGGHGYPGGKAKRIFGKVTDVIFFNKPLSGSDITRMSTYNN
jgi:hypothetical protein